MERRVGPISRLLSNVIEAHLELMKLSGASRYLNDNGWLRLYSDTNSFRHTGLERSYYDRYGLSYQILDRSGIMELEPNLTAPFEHGIWLDKLPSVRDPGAVCKAYAEYFLGSGGKLTRDEVRGISKVPGDGWSVHCSSHNHLADQVVVAAGAWSPRLLGISALKNPIAIERGYHLMFETTRSKELIRSVMDVDQGFVLTPMSSGIRATSATNLVARETGPDYTQINELIPRIRATFPVGRQLSEQPWMGRRPSTADSLPIIGPSAHHPGLWHAFGHGHLGFSLGPVTGKIVGEAMAGGRDPRNDPFLPSRFSFRENVS